MTHHFFHVTSVRNRESITRFGLDSSRMAGVRGIAGSNRPEVDGIFLCRDRQEADWFVNMNNTGDSVDIWAVKDVEHSELLDGGSGFLYVPGSIPVERLVLVEEGLTGGTMGPQKFV